MGPLEVLFLPRIPITMLREAADDIAIGAPSLRAEAWGIIKTSPIERTGNVKLLRRDIRYPHYEPPPGVYLCARLTVTSEYRNMPRPFDTETRKEALAQLAAWAASRNLRFVVPAIQ